MSGSDLTSVNMRSSIIAGTVMDDVEKQDIDMSGAVLEARHGQQA
jgi:hypothetical protein